ncbi:hypothetical protein HELRODRAFT_170197 [Helobdella robusta]|uniref:Peptidase S1 domain-containing protein n=1 Tax=Helobdella robusta TaxID=6412 RepID=T1F2S0_HELRO|nr:hypothetical protein HELRODRAFT_170197 [Helobdella robusta]ESO07666.1 hypothetical protein HELRODRAFT_170197 [Helobdella robusta]
MSGKLNFSTETKARIAECTIHLGSVYKFDDSWERFTIETVFLHKDNDRSSLLNDIALVKLRKKVRFSHYIQPICLPRASTSTVLNNLCISSGFGYTLKNVGSNRMLKIRMSILQCNERWDVICIGAYENLIVQGISNICKGDSGGPFSCKSVTEDRWTLYGIHSYVAGFEKTQLGINMRAND